MNIAPAMAKVVLEKPSRQFSDEGRERLLSLPGEPLFLAHWERALFIHFAVDAVALQRAVPFQLDLRRGKAFVTFVAFTMRDMRPQIGGKLAAWIFKPVATHRFLNARTYVMHGGERGIYFIAEWLSNWLSVQLGPPLYGLPYRHAKLDYRHAHENNFFRGTVEVSRRGGRLAYEARLTPGVSFAPCETDSPDEFLLERYTAYSSRGTTRRTFRVWHPPWPQTRAEVSIADDSLPAKTWPWFQTAKLIGANYSPGLRDVWMGRSRFVK
jgi:uncharacterized protein